MYDPRRGKYGFRFSDRITSANRKALLGVDLPVHEEAFYWTPNMPELVVKQCHVVRRALESKNYEPLASVDSLDISTQGRRLTFVRSSRGDLVTLPTINTILYKGWDTSTFSLGKAGGGNFLSKRDRWVLSKLNEDAVIKWRKALEVGFDRFKRLGLHTKSTLMSTQPYYL
jgi:hypothetical protein